MKPEVKVLHSDSRFIANAMRKPTVCELKLLQIGTQKVLVLTERCYNPGMSVTNAVEYVVMSAYVQLKDMLPELRDLVVIEHYDELSYKGSDVHEPTFDVVQLAYGASEVPQSPVWTPLRDPELLEVLQELYPLNAGDVT
jgi:hypothetical protein